MLKGENREYSTSVKITPDLKRRIGELLPLRDLTFSKLIHELLEKYLKDHPMTPEEKRFLASKKKSL